MDAPLELIISVFNDKERANKTMDEIVRLTKDGNFELKDAAVLVKDEKGDVHMHDREDVGPGRGALFGAITGGLIGLLGGPAGVIAGALAGAATGGVTASVVDMGFSNEQLNELKASMPANSSALVVLIEHTWVDKLVRELETRRGKMFRHEVSPDIARQYENRPR